MWKDGSEFALGGASGDIGAAKTLPDGNTTLRQEVVSCRKGERSRQLEGDNREAEIAAVVAGSRDLLIEPDVEVAVAVE